MSLLLAIAHSDSVLIAYDAFVMNNSKQELFKFLDFNKHYFCQTRKELFTFVGSSFVFERFKEWLKSDPCQDANFYLSKWHELDASWIDELTGEEMLHKHEANSILLFVNQNRLPDIQLIAQGQLHHTNTYIAVGSGSAFVQEIIEQNSDPADLESVIDLAIKCFRTAANDLFVSGIPHFILLKPDAVVEFEQSKAIYEANLDRYYETLKKSLKDIGS